MFAQTEDNPLVLNVGVNELTLDGSSNYYYTYTAGNEGDEFICIAVNVSNWISVYDGETGSSLSVTNAGSKGYGFVASSGKTYKLAVNVYSTSATEATLTVTRDVLDYAQGESAETAIALSEEQAVVPPHYNAETGLSTNYATFTSDVDGLAFIYVTAYLSSITIQEGDGEATDLAFNYEENGYLAKAVVEADKTYIVKMTGYSAFPYFAWCNVIKPEVGSMCDMPFESEDGNFTIPAAAGKYWFHYNYKNTDGFVVVTSDADLGADGGASLINDCNNSYAETRSYGRVALRKRIGSDSDWDPVYSECFICVTKTAETEGEESMVVTEVEVSPGDTFANPLALEGNEMTTPDFSGEYFYKFTAPEGDAQYAIVDARASNLVNSQVMVVAADNQYWELGNENDIDYVKAPVEGGKNYVVWVRNFDDKAISFTLSFEPILPGDLYEAAIETEVGENTLVVGDKYYAYTMEQNAWLKVDAGDANIVPVFYMDNSGWNFYGSTADGTGYKINGSEGVTYVFKISGVETEGKFTVSEIPYEQGENKSNPFIAVEGDNQIPQAVGDFWFKYTVKDNSLLTITSDMPYEYNDNWETSKVLIQGPYDSYATGCYDYTSERFVKITPAIADDDYLIEVVTINDNGYNLSVEEGSFDQLTKIELNGTVETPSIYSSSSTKWYYASFPSAGTFTIGTDMPSGAYNWFEMYSIDNLKQYVACTESISDEMYNYCYKLTYNVPEAGEYILGLTTCYASSVNTSWVADETSGINNVNFNSENAEVYDLSGRKLANIGNKGIFIVKTADGKTRKVMVK